MYSYRQHIKETIKLALPISIGQLGHIMLGVTDSIMVGHVGAAQLAASSLVNGLVWLVVVFGFGLTLALTPLTAIERGKGRVTECGVILRQGLIVNVFFAILLVMTLYFLSGLIAYLKQPEDVAELAISYGRIVSFSIFPFMIFGVYRQFIEGLSFMKPAMYVLLITNVVNVFANWVLIYGNLGSPAYGLDGAGYATFISRMFMALVMIVYVLNAKSLKPFEPGFRFKRIDFKVMREIIRIGIPMGFQHFFEVGAFSFSAVMIGWMGSKELAAHQIALSLASITFMLITGLSSATTVRIGFAFGQNDMPHIRRAGFGSLYLTMMVMSVFGLSFILLRNYLPLIFMNDPDVLSITASLLVIAALFQISDGSQAVGLGMLRGIKDVKIPTYYTLIAYWIIGLPVGYLLGFRFGYGVNGIWLGFLAGLTTAAFLLILRFKRQTRQVHL